MSVPGRSQARTGPEARSAEGGPLSLRDLLAQRLDGLGASVLEIQDDSAEHAGHAGNTSGGGHFSLTIVSEHFCGLTRLARHRAVLDRVGDLIPNPVHALAIQAYAPDEFPV